MGPISTILAETPIACVPSVMIAHLTPSPFLASPINQGRPHTPESRAKIAAANKGKVPWNVGKKHSPETRERIRERTRIAMQKRKMKMVEDMGMTLEEYEEVKRAQRAARQMADRLKRQEKGGFNETEFRWVGIPCMNPHLQVKLVHG